MRNGYWLRSECPAALRPADFNDEIQHAFYFAAAGAGGLIRASSQCSLIKLFSIRTTSKWFHLYSRLGSSGSLAVRSHIISEYGPLISLKTGAFTHSGLI